MPSPDRGSGMIKVVTCDGLRGSGAVSAITALARLAEALCVENARVLVAVDGPDAAGKTVFADALARHMRGPVVRASVDGFHNPAEIRARRGSLSPDGYYRDSFDYAALVGGLLEPFAAGAPVVRTAIYDHRRHASAVTEAAVARTSALIVDGVFLLRAELRRWWSLSVYLHVPPEVTLRRALGRDASLFGSREETERRYRLRYLPGQQLYRAEARPEDEADVVLDNSDPLSPSILKWKERETC